MSNRQHSPLILVNSDRSSRELPLHSMQAIGADGGYLEDFVQDMFYHHPSAIPLSEIDPVFGPLVPLCRELGIPTKGFADIFFINANGLPTLVECKLWRNPEARRKVLAQILDYASILQSWDYSKLQAAVRSARKEPDFDIVGHMRKNGHPDIDEPAFIAAIDRNLAAGRMLLLIIGDGIRSGMGALAEYLQSMTGTQFTLALVEAPVYALDNDRKIIQPRILAKTQIIQRVVVELATATIRTDDGSRDDAIGEDELPADAGWRSAFWTEMLASLRFDDPEQMPARATGSKTIVFPLQSKTGMGITCYFSQSDGCIGVFLRINRSNSLGMEVGRRLYADREAVAAEFSVPLRWSVEKDGKLQILARKPFSDLQAPDVREEELSWFRSTVREFARVLRPRIDLLAAEIGEGG